MNMHAACVSGSFARFYARNDRSDGHRVKRRALSFFGRTGAFSRFSAGYAAHNILHHISVNVLIYRATMVLLDDFYRLNNLNKLRMIVVFIHLNRRVIYRLCRAARAEIHFFSLPSLFKYTIVYVQEGYMACSLVLPELNCALTTNAASAAGK
jgi:hypothetical protein